MESHKWIRYSGGVTFATLTCLQVTRDYMRDQIDAAALGLVEALDQGDSDGIWLNLAQ